MGVSRALELGCHAPIHLRRLELREQLVVDGENPST
jgi:hypothetical protein